MLTASTQDHHQRLQQHVEQPAMPPASSHDPQRELGWQQRPREGCEWGGTRRRVELAAGLFALFVQLAVWSRTARSLGLRGHLHQAALVSIVSVFMGLTLFLPHEAWKRYRVWLITVLRICVSLVPSHRSATEGTAVLLHHAATPGLRGVLVDYLRVAIGTRVLFQMVGGSILFQPPLAVLLQQCAIMALLSNSQGYCSCPLLNNPLTARRLALLSRCLDAIPLFTVPLVSTAMLHHQENNRYYACAAVLYMHQAVTGVVIPTVLASCAWNAAEAAPPGQQPQRRQERQQQRSALRQLLSSAVSRLEVLWQRANQVLQEVCTGAGMPGVQLALAAWLLTGNLWMVSVALAEREL